MKITPSWILWTFIGALASALLISATKNGGITSFFESEPVAAAPAPALDCIEYDKAGKRIGPCSAPPSAGEICQVYGLDGKFIRSEPCIK